MIKARNSPTPAIFLVLCQIICAVSAQQCRDEYSIYGMKLKRHIFKKVKALNWGACVQACNGDIRCQSMNYVISKEMCELSNRTKEARPEDFVPDKNRSYMKRFNKRVSLGSIPELPAESCAEIKANEGDNAVSGNYWFDSIKPGESVLAPCNMLIEECQNAQTLAEGDRKITHGSSPLSLCDNGLGPAWFRFQGNAGKKMAASCVPSNRCGTHATGWLNGANLTVEDGQVTRQVCFSWGSNCCYWSINIQVRNCGEYFIYYISGTPPEHRCHLRFCGSD